MSEQPILEVQNVSKGFGGITALNRVSFHVNAGEILGVIGPNGSGKTTLINCITGFIKMTSGRVLFRGKDIAGADAIHPDVLGGIFYRRHPGHRNHPAFGGGIVG